MTAFVGREREREQLDLALAQARGGRGAVFLFAGEPGIGKTRLANELADAALAQGVTVLWGRCWEGGGAPSLWPWLQILRAVVAATSDADLGERLGRGAPEIADLVPEVRRRLPEIGESPSVAPDQSRFRLLDSVASLITRTAAALRPLVLVLDDLHSADELALQLMQFLAREARRIPLLMLGTYRRTETRQNAAVARIMESIAREANVFNLEGLSPMEVQRYLRGGLSTAPSSSLVNAVHARTEGNPFFLGEIARLLRSNPPGRLGDFDVPQEVFAAIRRRLEPLSPQTRRCLQVAAVIGREFDASFVAGLEVWDEQVEVAACIEQAAEADVATSVRGPGRRFRFPHELVRETLSQEIPASERRLLHRKVAEKLERVRLADPDTHLPALAHHFCEAAAGGELSEKALEYAVRAAEHAARRHVYEDAVRYYNRALSVLGDDSTAERRRIDLLIERGEAHWLAGQPENARDTFAEVAGRVREHARDPSHPEASQLFARAALGFGGAALGSATGATGTTNRQLVRLLEEALELIGPEDSPLRSQLLGRLALAMIHSTDAERRLALSRESVAVARRTGNRTTLAWALVQSNWGGWSPENVHERLADKSETIALAHELQDPQIALAAHGFRVLDLLEVGDIAAADREIVAHAALAEELRHPFHLFTALRLRGLRAMLDGRLAESEAVAHQILAAGERVDEWVAYLTYLGQSMLLALLRGHFHELEDALEDAVHRHPELPTLRAALGLACCHSRRYGAARHNLELLAADNLAGITRDYIWPFVMALLAEVCCALNDTARGATIYQQFLPYGGRFIVVGFAGIYGAAGRQLGMLAEMLGRPAEAVQHFEQAIAVDTAVGARPTLALAQYAYARFLSAGSEAQRRRSLELLECAHETAEEIGMEGLAQKALQLRRTLSGGRPKPDQQSAANAFRRTDTGWSLDFAGKSVVVKDRKGLRYIAELLREPERECHVADLVALTSTAPNAPPELSVRPQSDAALPDQRARAAYRERLQDLHGELDQAERNHDLGRASKLRAEIESLTDELAQSYGWGRKSRAAGDPVEKMRKAVLGAIRNALRDIEGAHHELGRHLQNSLATGVFCSYRPEQPVSWLVQTE